MVLILKKPVQCIRDKEAIRIISARKATKTETKFYDQYVNYERKL